MVVLDGQSCRTCAHLALTEPGGHWSALARVFAALVLAIVIVMGVVCAFAVVVAPAALVLQICMALVVRTSEVEPKLIFMGHEISSCHAPVVSSFFILFETLVSS
jgi:hypothetical protein